MKRNIILGLVLVLILGGVVYALIDKKENPPMEESSIEQNEEENPQEEDNMDELDDQADKKAENDGKAEITQPTIAVGEKLPNFTLQDLEGKEKSLSDYGGKILLINFWATWCEFCDAEMPDLQRLSEENDDLVVLGVNVEEDKTIVQEYINKGGYTFEILLDEYGEVAMDYLVSGLPASYFTNEDGVFLGRVPGMLTYEQMNEILEDIRINK